MRRFFVLNLLLHNYILLQYIGLIYVFFPNSWIKYLIRDEYDTLTAPTSIVANKWHIVDTGYTSKVK